MLQQTRAAAVVPFYERFLTRFPDLAALARATEEEVLAIWSGLGYYSRARNVHKAAGLVERAGAFPGNRESIRALPGVGAYTAAAIASIAFGEPCAVLDGNVARVLARVLAEGGDIAAPATRRRLQAAADLLLDRRSPGDSNQALMELGAVICLPREPRCAACPIARYCQARRAGQQRTLPVKPPRRKLIRIRKTLLLIRQANRLLLWQRGPDSSRLAGFWELPEAGQLPDAARGETVGWFLHTIASHEYRITLVNAEPGRLPPGFRWLAAGRLGRIPLSTQARKALALAGSEYGAKIQRHRS